MEKNGIYIDQRQDKIIYPKKYFSSAMWNKKREATTLKVQCHVRAWFARKTANGLRKKRDDRDNELLTKQADLRDKEEHEHKEEIERRMHPKKTKDFEILYNELEAWRLNETKKIKGSTELKEEEKKLALQFVNSASKWRKMVFTLTNARIKLFTQRSTSHQPCGTRRERLLH